MSTNSKPSNILVAGFAHLPKGTPVFEMQKSIGCIIIVDTETKIIIDASFTFLQDITNNFISGLLRGKSLNKIDEIIKEIENSFIVPPQKAVIQAFINAKKNFDANNYFINEKENACN